MDDQRSRAQILSVTLVTLLLLDDLVQMVLLPLMPSFIQIHQWAAWQAGVVLGGSTIGLILLSPVMGYWLAHGARAHLWFVVSAVATVGAVFALGQSDRFWAFAVATGVLGLAQASLSPVLFGSLGTLLPTNQRKVRFVLINRVAILGALLTPLLSAGLLAVLGAHTTFLVIAACLGIVTLGGASRIPPTIDRPISDSGGARPNRATLFWAVLVMAIVGLFEVLLPLRLAGPLHWTPADTALYYCGLGIIVAATQWGAEHCTALGSPVRRLVIAVIWLIAGIATLPWIQAPWPFAITAWGIAPAIGILLDLVFERAGEAPDAAIGFGWLEAALAAGSLVGTAGGGAMISWGGWPLPLWLLTAVLILTMIVLGVYPPALAWLRPGRASPHAEGPGMENPSRLRD